MDGDYDYDVDEAGDYDDDWLYVEEEFTLSDELAENQLASPGYAGTNFELSLESYEFELYAFWDDLEYADDAYWEYESAHSVAHRSSANIKKRSRTMAEAKTPTKRRRKIQSTSSHEGLASQDVHPVLFRSRKERDDRFMANPPLLEERVSFAFLSDWRERFAGGDGPVSSKPMPADMKEAAEGDADEDPNPLGLPEDDDAESIVMEDMAGDVGTQMADIDPDLLKSVLRQRLGDAGLQDMDEDMLMRIITQMVLGDGDADEATGNLANSLLGKITGDSGDERLTGWLSQQGVSFEDEGEDPIVAAEPRPNESIVDTGTSIKNSVVGPDNRGGADHSHSTRKRKAVPGPESSSKRPKATLGNPVKDSKTGLDSRPNVHHSRRTENVIIADSSAEVVDTSGSAADVLPGPDTRKRKRSRPEPHASQAVETKTSTQIDEKRGEPASEPSPVSKRIRKTRTKGN